MDEIPTLELQIILEKRSSLPPSFCAKMIRVMIELQRRRAATNVFAGKHGFVTPRDLFRWADRKAASYQMLAEAGFMLLGERMRATTEQAVVREVLIKLLPNVALDLNQMCAPR
jgi:midasin